MEDRRNPRYVGQGLQSFWSSLTATSPRFDFFLPLIKTELPSFQIKTAIKTVLRRESIIRASDFKRAEYSTLCLERSPQPLSWDRQNRMPCVHQGYVFTKECTSDALWERHPSANALYSMETDSIPHPQSPIFTSPASPYMSRVSLRVMRGNLPEPSKPALGPLQSYRVTDVKWGGTYAGNRCTERERRHETLAHWRAYNHQISVIDARHGQKHQVLYCLTTKGTF